MSSDICASCLFCDRPTYKYPCNNCVDGQYWKEKIQFAEPSPPKLDSKVKIDIPIYDQVETYHNCTVQILSNSVTGQTSIGWWQEGDIDDGS